MGWISQYICIYLYVYIYIYPEFDKISGSFFKSFRSWKLTALLWLSWKVKVVKDAGRRSWFYGCYLEIRLFIEIKYLLNHKVFFCQIFFRNACSRSWVSGWSWLQTHKKTPKNGALRNVLHEVDHSNFILLRAVIDALGPKFWSSTIGSCLQSHHCTSLILSLSISGMELSWWCNLKLPFDLVVIYFACFL